MPNPHNLVYLAAPYSDPNPILSQLRRKIVTMYAVHLIEKGNTVFSPLTYSEALSQLGLDQSENAWYVFDLHFLHRSQSLLLLQLPGWAQSTGVTIELNEARKLRIPIKYVPLNSLPKDILQTYRDGIPEVTSG